MKKIMFVGAVGTGKTTLTQRLEGHEIVYSKTQAIESSRFIVDTPGEFIQRRQFYSALQVTSSSVDYIGLLQSVDESFNTFPPAFASMFSKPVIGVVTKIDKANSEEEVSRAAHALKNAGAREIFNVSSYDDKGIEELLKFLGKEEDE